MRNQSVNTTNMSRFAGVVFLITLIAVAGLAQTASPHEPGPVKAVAPVYPLIALTAGISGTVTVEAQVDQQGIVTSIRTLDGPELLRPVSERAASRWRFESSSEASATRAKQLSFVFALMPRESRSEELVTIFLPPYRIEIKGTKLDLIQRVDSDPPNVPKRRRPKKKGSLQRN
jgi:Gram-negative bacterial TonB protein C-terminal